MLFKQPCDEGVVRSAAPCRDTGRGGRWVLLTAILGSSLAFVDGTVVNVALPALQRDLGATLADVQWVIEAYAVTFSALLLAGGAIGDRFGRRRTYGIGVALFAVASALCGLSPNVGALIAWRALQGVGAALLVPGSLALLAASFSERERGRAIGTWSGFSAMATAVGPVVGGWLIDHVSWRWAFLVNLPVAAATLILLFWRVPESRDPDAPRRLDLPGAVLATLGLGGLVFGLIEASSGDWGRPRVIAPFVAGLACLAGFVAVESSTRTPMLRLSLFRSRAFAGANLLTLALYAALAMVFFVLPLELIQVQGYSSTAAGAALLPMIGILFVLSSWSGGLVDRFGARGPLIVGPLLAAAGFALLARPGIGGAYLTTWFPALVVLGLGMALTVAPLTTTVMNSVEVSHAGIASGVNNAVSRTAGLIAVAVIGIPMLQVFEARLDRELAARGVGAATTVSVRHERSRMGSLRPPASATPAEREAVRAAVAEAFVAAVRVVVLAAAALALIAAAVAAWWLDAPPPRSRGRPG